MVRALPVKTNPIDRHFLLHGIIKEAYKRRIDPEMRRLCVEVGDTHLSEFPSIRSSLAEDMGGELPTVPAFKWVATALAEDGSYEKAIAICEAAANLGLSDGTGGGYSGRAAKLRAQAARQKP